MIDDVRGRSAHHVCHRGYADSPVAAWQSGCEAEMPPGPVSFLVTASLTAAARNRRHIGFAGGVGSSAPITAVGPVPPDYRPTPTEAAVRSER
jgi:hypothetical protein